MCDAMALTSIEQAAHDVWPVFVHLVLTTVCQVILHFPHTGPGRPVTAAMQCNAMHCYSQLAKHCYFSGAAEWLSSCGRIQVAIVPNTLAFNHVFEALHKAASQTCTAEARVALAENSVSLFNQMLHRGRPPPDCSTYDILAALLTEIGAGGQALHVCQLKRQKVCS